jgi:molybdopterin/thiamine biosynthesis adenylyltransferase/rhodanese-related sulfurtransferase
MLQQDRLTQLKLEIPEISPVEAAARSSQGAILLDIRDPDEMKDGSPAAAIRATRSFLELQIEAIAPDPGAELIVLCASGVRSLFAADALKRLGYRSVASVAGGFRAWREQGLAIDAIRLLSATERERYARHLKIPEVGEAGQARLLTRKVALVGAGGLGSPIAYYLAAAGVGTLGLIDDDRIERSNLQRQILHADARVGQLKARSAAETLTAFNPEVKIELHEVRLDAANAEPLLAGYDLVIDGSDNLATRYVVNDACVRLKIPMIYGAIFRFEGQVSAFWPSGPRGGPCYRCLFPEPPPPELTPSCAEAGVLGVLPGVIGSLMATEALKILLGLGDPLLGRLLTYDGLGGRFDELGFEANPHCPWCASAEAPDQVAASLAGAAA